MRSCAALCFLVFALTASVSAQDTVQVKAGWNIIGSVKAGAVPDVLSTVPDSIITTAFFGYNPGSGYESTDSLDKGLGYWVKVKEDGIIIFNTTPAIDSCTSKAFAYQGKFYNTVSIGDQCWMAQNLDVGTMIAGVTPQGDNATTEKWCFGDDPQNCTLYGGLYKWDEAMQYTATPGTQGICPPGWHIPTYAEFQTLSSAVGGDGNVLKAVGQGTGDGAGTNTSGFSALLTGMRYSGTLVGLGSYGYIWSSEEIDFEYANFLGVYDANSNTGLGANFRIFGFAVRCLED